MRDQSLEMADMRVDVGNARRISLGEDDGSVVDCEAAVTHGSPRIIVGCCAIVGKLSNQEQHTHGSARNLSGKAHSVSRGYRGPPAGNLSVQKQQEFCYVSTHAHLSANHDRITLVIS